ncbi:MAG: hypothetical protein CL942_06175 [Desulfovibrio sp.]|nr:hypothetical protein [Desulfovibrio sp.]|tara:strand:- start:17949 stop:19070 length:1122 start_codon:yes stop_codon:yes gene_type:complete
MTTQNIPYTIAFVVGGLPFGGVETLLLQTVLELQKRNHTPVVINISGTGDLHESFLGAKIPVLTIGDNTKVLKTTSFSTTYKLRQLIKKVKPDIIHTAHFSAHYHTRIAALGVDIPIVTHCHNTKREKKFSRRFADKLLSYVTSIYIAVAKEVEKQGVQPYNWAKRPCEVLYNAIDLKALQSASETDIVEMVAPEGPILFSVCRLVTQKNIDILLDVAASLKTRIPGLNVIIIGDGPEKTNLIEQAQRLGLKDNILFTGFRHDVPEIMKALSKRKALLVMPSSFEGFGIAPLEGFYFGIPAIISPNVPIVEIAKEAVEVVPVEKTAMTKRIYSLLSDSEKLKHMSTVAQNVAKQYSIEFYINRLLKIYDKVKK